LRPSISTSAAERILDIRRPEGTEPEPPPSKILSGFIRADELYTLPELQRRLGIRQAAWRVLRRKGLPCYQVGKRVLVFGQDFFEFVRKQGKPD